MISKSIGDLLNKPSIYNFQSLLHQYNNRYITCSSSSTFNSVDNHYYPHNLIQILVLPPGMSN